MRSRPLKRLRVAEAGDSKPSVQEYRLPEVCQAAPSSAMLQEYKHLGVVTTSVPVCVTRLGSEHFVVASLGRQFAVYCTEKLHVKFLSPVLPGEVTALASADELTYVALSTAHSRASSACPVVEVYNRFIRLASVSFPKFKHTEIRRISLFGDFLVLITASGLFSVLSRDNTRLLASLVEVPVSAVGSQPLWEAITGVTCVTAIPTYTHKLLLGLKTGELVLVNVAKHKTVHRFLCLAAASSADAVTCLTSARALDVVAVGTQSGFVHLVNVKTDQLLQTFRATDAAGAAPVTGVQFLSAAAGAADGHSKELLLAAVAGDLVVFDLTKKTFVGKFPVCMGGGGAVSSVAALDALPLVLTADTENAVRLWLFDKPDGTGRLLRERAGFRGSLRKVVPLSATECIVATDAGEVGRVSLIQNQQTCVFSDKNLQSFGGEAVAAGLASAPVWTPYGRRRLPPVTDLAVNTLRGEDWPSVVTVHSGESRAFVWSLVQNALVCRMLQPRRRPLSHGHGGDGHSLTACAISACGNFAAVGSSAGHVFRFNLQSCREQQPQSQKQSQKQSQPLKGGRVLGLHWRRGGALVAVSGRQVVDSEFGDMATSVRGGLTVACSSLAPHSALLALGYVEGALAVVDLATDTEVRFFFCSQDAEGGGGGGGECGPVTSVAWSEDQLLVSFSFLSGALKVLDLQANTLRDQVQLDAARPVTAMAFVQGGLVACRGGARSLQLFSNLLDLHGPAARPPCPRRPVALENCDDGSDDGSDGEQQRQQQGGAGAEQQTDCGVHAGLVRRSAVSSQTQQRQLLHLAEIRSRNRVEAVKTKEVPFFLRSSSGVDGHVRFEVATQAQQQAQAQSTQQQTQTRPTSAEEAFLAEVGKGNWGGVLERLKAMSASGVHVALGCLSATETEQMAEFFAWLVASGEEADLGQVWLALFLKEHGETLQSGSSAAVEELATAVQEQEQRLWSLGNRVNCFARMIISGDVLL